MMIDSHCHLDARQYNEDRSAVIERAFASGVQAIVIPAIGPDAFDGLLRLGASDPRLFCGIGIHPHAALQADDKALLRVRELTASNKVVAVGEIGLDYHYDFAPQDIQRDTFRRQLAIAREVDLPVIIHNREATDDVLGILEKEQDGRLRGVLHCFSETPDVAARTLDLGFLVSFTGNITFKKSTLAATVGSVPLDKMMIETDGPYLAPVPDRGKRNEPAFVRRVAEKIADIHSKSFEEVVAMTTKAAKNLFRLTLMFLFMLPLICIAQSEESSEEDEYYYEDEEYVEGDDEDIEYEDEFENPYPKLIGFGPILGANTIVETEQFLSDGEQQERDISHDGLISFGGTLSYGLSDHFMLQASYLFSKNNKVVEQGAQVNPNTHQLYDLSLHYSPNPYNRIAFYISLGPSYFNNNYDDRIDDSHFGINGGISLIGNISTSFGMLTPVMEWRVSSILGNRKLDGNERSFFSSIPRFVVLWYPDV